MNYKGTDSSRWALLSPEEKKYELFLQQKELLATFLSTGAICQAQHDKSLNCLIEKMEIDLKELQKYKTER